MTEGYDELVRRSRHIRPAVATTVTEDGVRSARHVPESVGDGECAPRGRPRRPAPEPPIGNRTARFAWGAVVVILIGVIVLIVYALTGPPATLLTVHRSPPRAA